MVTACGLAWFLNNLWSVSCWVKWWSSHPLWPPWGLPDHCDFCSCIYFWCLLDSRTSFLPTVLTIWLPSLIFAFQLVCQISFLNDLYELFGKLALFMFLVCCHLALFFIYFYPNRCLDKLDCTNTLISFMVSRLYIYCLESTSYSKIMNKLIYIFFCSYHRFIIFKSLINLAFWYQLINLIKLDLFGVKTEERIYLLLNG